MSPIKTQNPSDLPREGWEVFEKRRQTVYLRQTANTKLWVRGGPRSGWTFQVRDNATAKVLHAGRSPHLGDAMKTAEELADPT